MEIKDLAGLSEPLTRLIEVIAQGIGAVTRPYLIRRNAEARAYEIKVITESCKQLGSVNYEGDKFSIVVSPEEATPALSLPERTESRRQYQELRKQQNIEAVCANAAEELVGIDEVPEAKPEPDWISRLFDIAENVSSEDFQYLWGKILAGEIKQPGSFSLRTLEVVKNLSQQEAMNFEKLRQYVLSEKNLSFYLEPRHCEALDLNDILGLKDAGLISNSDRLVYSLDQGKAGETSYLVYGSLLLSFEREKDLPQINQEVLLLTRAGMELLKLTEIKPDMAYVGFVAKQFSLEGMKVSWSPIFGKEGDALRLGDATYIEV